MHIWAYVIMTYIKNDQRERSRRGLRFLVQGIDCLLDKRRARNVVLA